MNGGHEHRQVNLNFIKVIMRLWTIQHLGAWEAARTLGYLKGDPVYAFGDGFWEPSYRWMVEQMHERVPGFSGDLPIWAWVRRPDLRAYHAGLGYVFLRLDVPRQRVLLSDFDAWHCVLNLWYSSRTESEDMALPAPPHDIVTPEMRATWANIFDLDRHSDAERYWLGADVDVQACVDRVYLDEVKQARVLRRRVN